MCLNKKTIALPVQEFSTDTNQVEIYMMTDNPKSRLSKKTLDFYLKSAKPFHALMIHILTKKGVISNQHGNLLFPKKPRLQNVCMIGVGNGIELLSLGSALHPENIFSFDYETTSTVKDIAASFEHHIRECNAYFTQGLIQKEGFKRHEEDNGDYNAIIIRRPNCMSPDFLMHTLPFLKSEIEKGVIEFILITIAWDDIDSSFSPEIKKTILNNLHSIGGDNKAYQQELYKNKLARKYFDDGFDDGYGYICHKTSIGS